jgi:hypothetical protein
LYSYRTERLGYLLYDSKQQVVDCLEGVKIQFGMVDVISDVSVQLFVHSSMGLVAQQSVGVYSSVLGYHGGDSVSPTSYKDLSVSAIDIYLYLQVSTSSLSLSLSFSLSLLLPLSPLVHSPSGLTFPRLMLGLVGGSMC